MVKVVNGISGEKITINIDYTDITLHELMCELELNTMHIGAVLVDGVPKKLTDRLKDNSEVYILPVLEGGC